MPAFNLKIVTPHGVHYEGEAEAITVDGVWKEFDGNDDRNACCSGDLLEVTTVQFIEDAISISNPEIL